MIIIGLEPNIMDSVTVSPGEFPNIYFKIFFDDSYNVITFIL